MRITNEAVSKKFDELADLLEIEGANPFRVRAYRNAARSISSLGKNVSEMTEDSLTDIPGIGKDLADKIREIIESGELTLLNETERKTPPILSELMKIEGLGPKRVKLLYEALKIKSIDDLLSAIEDGKLKALRGFGEKTAARIKAGIKNRAQYAQRSKLADVWSMAELLLQHIKRSDTIKQADIAGSFRRRKEVVGDLDLLASATNPSQAINHFLQFDQIAAITAKGTTRAAVRLSTGMQVDFRVVPKESYGAALLYFTGSKDHNVSLRKMALEKGCKLSEYGLFKGKEHRAGRTEKEVYQALGLHYVEPELREAQGEIEASLKNRLPNLVELEDIRGDLHVHTNETDGADSLEAMIRSAKALGYEYIAITDHSRHLTVARGLDEKRLLKQLEAIDKLSETFRGIKVLKAIELDILEKGQLDLPDRVLKELDLTVCSIHSRFHLSVKEQTERIIRAMDNPYFTILAHPTGRLVNRRPAYELDLERVMRAALEKGCFLELNAQPERLDLNDIYCRMAKDMGLKLSIASDAHSSTHYSFLKFGVFQARRGWLEKGDILNTRSLSQLRKLLAR